MDANLYSSFLVSVTEYLILFSFPPCGPSGPSGLSVAEYCLRSDVNSLILKFRQILNFKVISVFKESALRPILSISCDVRMSVCLSVTSRKPRFPMD